jgi:hypothetical protein
MCLQERKVHKYGNHFPITGKTYNKCHAYTQTFCIPMNKIFANCSEEDIIYPAMAAEITEAQWPDATFKLLFKYNAAVDK